MDPNSDLKPIELKLTCVGFRGKVFSGSDFQVAAEAVSDAMAENGFRSKVYGSRLSLEKDSDEAKARMAQESDPSYVGIDFINEPFSAVSQRRALGEKLKAAVNAVLPYTAAAGAKVESGCLIIDGPLHNPIILE